MPRKSVWPPRPHLHRPSGQARVRIHGKDYYLGPWESEAARLRYTELLAELTRTGQASPSPAGKPVSTAPTVSDVLARFWRHAEKRLSERGRELEQYRLSVEPLIRLFGGLEAARLDAARLMELQDAMLSGSWMTPEDIARSIHRQRRQGWARKLVNQRINRIRSVWRWAELVCLAPPGSFAALKAVASIPPGAQAAREERERRPSTLKQVKQVLVYLTVPVLRAMLLVQWWAGCRPGEVRTMRAGDVDMGGYECGQKGGQKSGHEVGGSGQVWVYRPRQHKTDRLGHERVIHLGPRAQAVLRPWLERAREKGPDSPVFPSSRQGRGRKPNGFYTAHSYSQAVSKAARKAGLRGFFVSYGTRHAARDRVTKSHGIEAARIVLGHRSLDTTMKYGTRIDHVVAADVARRLG